MKKLKKALKIFALIGAATLMILDSACIALAWEQIITGIANHVNIDDILLGMLWLTFSAAFYKPIILASEFIIRN